jgi:hypothetical protein
VSQPFQITNGVKQGGVMSPFLFGVYMDQLFDKLSNSYAECRIGQIFMGAFGYADDVVLLAPTKGAINVMLDTSLKFSHDFDVMF